MNMLDKAQNWLLRISSWIGWSALLLMMAIGTLDVIGTFFFHRSIIGAFEMAETALAVVMFVGLVHVQADRAHINVDLLTKNLRGWPARLAESFGLLATALALFLIARQTWPLMLDSVRIGEVAGGSFNFPVYPVKVLVCLGASAATMVAILQFLRSLSGLSSSRDGAAR
jgi:TRAP-type C4-dicarboxylate transport system permease small subunit